MMKGKIRFIIGMVFILFIIFFVSAQKIDYSFPNDPWSDRVLSLNQSGENFTAENFFYSNDQDINSTIIWDNSTGEVRLKSAQNIGMQTKGINNISNITTSDGKLEIIGNVEIADNLTSSKNTSGIGFKTDGGIRFWLYDP